MWAKGVPIVSRRGEELQVRSFPRSVPSLLRGQGADAFPKLPAERVWTPMVLQGVAEITLRSRFKAFLSATGSFTFYSEKL